MIIDGDSRCFYQKGGGSKRERASKENEKKI